MRKNKRSAKFDGIKIIKLFYLHCSCKKVVEKENKGQYTYENCLIFKNPTRPCPSTSKFFFIPWPWTSNFEPASHPLPSSTNYGTTQKLLRAFERAKLKQKKTKSSHIQIPRVLLFDLAHKKYSGIIKRWLYCLHIRIIY